VSRERAGGCVAQRCAPRAAGHHPPRSNGHHNNTHELLELLEPVLEARAPARLAHVQHAPARACSRAASTPCSSACWLRPPPCNLSTHARVARLHTTAARLGSGGDARGRSAQAHGVQAYLAGHDHNLEHIHVPGASVHYIISGGGSKSDRGFIGAAHSAFQWPASGFVAARLGRDELVLEFLCYTGGAGRDDLRPCYVARVPRAR